MGAGGHAELEFVRPTVDRLQYGQIKLPNGLEAIVVSDKDADKASAALDVSCVCLLVILDHSFTRLHQSSRYNDSSGFCCL